MTRSFGKSNASPGTTPGKIRNVGPKSAAWLKQVGVRSEDDVIRLGALECFMKVKRAGFKAGLNLLYALAGAEDGCHWQELSAERKQSLLIALDAAVALLPPTSKFGGNKTGAMGARLVSQALGSSEKETRGRDEEW
jgi:hypothetical protein